MKMLNSRIMQVEREREKKIGGEKKKENTRYQFYLDELHLAEESQATESALSPSDFKYRSNTVAVSCIAIIHVMRSSHQNHLRNTERAPCARFTLVCLLSWFGRGRRRQAYGRMIIDQRLEYFRRERNSPKFPTLGVLRLSYHLARGVLIAIYAFELRHLYSIPTACSPNSKLFIYRVFYVDFARSNRFELSLIPSYYSLRSFRYIYITFILQCVCMLNARIKELLKALNLFSVS